MGKPKTTSCWECLDAPIVKAGKEMHVICPPSKWKNKDCATKLLEAIRRISPKATGRS